MLNGTTDYWALLGTLNLSSAYKPRSQPYSLATHGSHTVNGVQLIPGAPGYDPKQAYGQWIALMTGGPPAPTIVVSGSATGFTVALNVVGTVAMSLSGSLGSFAAGSTLLSEQTTLKEGFLTLSASGLTSTATSQYVVLGTGGDNTIDATAAGSRIDYVFGGAGNDTIRGGDGNDILLGGTGNDTIYGNEDDDLIYGGEGNDAIQAGQGNDTVYGEAGDDTINGGTTGDDVLDGGAGNDHITGGAGVDTLTGGDGDDRFYYALSDDLFASGQAVDSIDGCAGTNTLVLADRTLLVQNAFVIAATDSWSRITNISRIEAEGSYSAQFNLTLSDDAYEAGLRVIDLSADTETSNANFINVSAETGTANGYTLIGHGGTDFITGGAGNDIVTGSADADTLSGGAGNDVFLYTDNLQLREDTSVAGGDGFDTIEFSVAIDTLNSGSLQGDNFHADFTKVTLVERIKLAGASLINLGDVLPGAGITTIATGNDNTTLRYDNIALGTLTIDATALADNKTLTLTQFGSPGAGQWFNITNLKGDVNAAGLEGGISVTVATGTGTGFNVSVVGGNGNDTLVSGAGNDSLTGGAGADTFNVKAGTDTVSDLGGSDLLVVSAGAIANASVTAHFTATAATSNAGVANLKLANGVNADLSLAAGPVGYNINADRNTSASRIVGSEFADDIYGGNVNDTIIAGAGDDIIRGGAGADTIDTGTGTNTIIVGGTGAIAAGESYTGGGTDTLFVTGTTDFGGVTVIDSIETILLAAGVSATFEAAALTGDTIAVNGTGDNGQESLIVRGTASNDTINLGGLTLDTNDISGATINGLGGDDTITGTNGGDTIAGGVNADAITGKAGADAIYLGVDTAADTVRADEGDGQMLIAGEIAHLDSDRVEQFNANHDKFAVSGAGTSVILNGVAAAQAAGTAFQSVATGAFDLDGAIGGAYITGAAVGNLRAFDDVKTAIGALANESIGEEAYFVLRDGGGAGNAGVYHFRSVTANGLVDVGEVELLGLVLTGAGSNLTGLGAGNFVFA